MIHKLFDWESENLPTTLRFTFFHADCRSIGVNGVTPSLVNVNEKHNVITKTTETMHGWHSNDEGKQIINECV
jgi:hypothetical protein